MLEKALAAGRLEIFFYTIDIKQIFVLIFRDGALVNDLFVHE
ncbi:hypothetical protein CEV32_2339 [Brucella rhizosphaerae]|uniref:Uncharacterized protein n=1 Tax=Brucella rhizosphaerae TaxID=571254 RepID=A0A256F4X8_9HYPH|nr:hypothetical protein CEV32_2339 [Brucella rhizosphaerae]